MNIKYPNGQIYQNNKIKISNANRGISFEEAINKTNEFYINRNIALIYKKPTPVQIVKIDRYNKNKITDAYFLSKSTTDYNGVYKGKYIDFEAKSCLSKTSFPLKNILPHQIKHLERVLLNGGIAFFLINLKALNEVYLLPASYIIYFYKANERKSIPIKEIKNNGHIVLEGYLPRFNYLKVLDDLHLTLQ